MTDLGAVLSPASCQSARELLKMSQAELAARAKVSATTLRRFERGESGISAYATKQLKQALSREGVLLLRGDRAIMI